MDTQKQFLQPFSSVLHFFRDFIDVLQQQVVQYQPILNSIEQNIIYINSICHIYQKRIMSLENDFLENHFINNSPYLHTSIIRHYTEQYHIFVYFVSLIKQHNDLSETTSFPHTLPLFENIVSLCCDTNEKIQSISHHKFTSLQLSRLYSISCHPQCYGYTISHILTLYTWLQICTLPHIAVDTNEDSFSSLIYTSPFQNVLIDSFPTITLTSDEFRPISPSNIIYQAQLFAPIFDSLRSGMIPSIVMCLYSLSPYLEDVSEAVIPPESTDNSLYAQILRYLGLHAPFQHFSQIDSNTPLSTQYSNISLFGKLANIHLQKLKYYASLIEQFQTDYIGYYTSSSEQKNGLLTKNKPQLTLPPVEQVCLSISYAIFATNSNLRTFTWDSNNNNMSKTQTTLSLNIYDFLETSKLIFFLFTKIFRFYCDFLPSCVLPESSSYSRSLLSSPFSFKDGMWVLSQRLLYFSYVIFLQSFLLPGIEFHCESATTSLIGDNDNQTSGPLLKKVVHSFISPVDGNITSNYSHDDIRFEPSFMRKLVDTENYNNDNIMKSSSLQNNECYTPLLFIVDLPVSVDVTYEQLDDIISGCFSTLLSDLRLNIDIFSTSSTLPYLNQYTKQSQQPQQPKHQSCSQFKFEELITNEFSITDLTLSQSSLSIINEPITTSIQPFLSLFDNISVNSKSTHSVLTLPHCPIPFVSSSISPYHPTLHQQLHSSIPVEWYYIDITYLLSQNMFQETFTALFRLSGLEFTFPQNGSPLSKDVFDHHSNHQCITNQTFSSPLETTVNNSITSSSLSSLPTPSLSTPLLPVDKRPGSTKIRQRATIAHSNIKNTGVQATLQRELEQNQHNNNQQQLQQQQQQNAINEVNFEYIDISSYIGQMRMIMSVFLLAFGLPLNSMTISTNQDVDNNVILEQPFLTNFTQPMLQLVHSVSSTATNSCQIMQLKKLFQIMLEIDSFQQSNFTQESYYVTICNDFHGILIGSILTITGLLMPICLPPLASVSSLSPSHGLSSSAALLANTRSQNIQKHTKTQYQSLLTPKDTDILPFIWAVFQSFFPSQLLSLPLLSSPVVLLNLTNYQQQTSTKKSKNSKLFDSKTNTSLQTYTSPESFFDIVSTSQASTSMHYTPSSSSSNNNLLSITSTLVTEYYSYLPQLLSLCSPMNIIGLHIMFLSGLPLISLQDMYFQNQARHHLQSFKKQLLSLSYAPDLVPFLKAVVKDDNNNNNTNSKLQKANMLIENTFFNKLLNENVSYIIYYMYSSFTLHYAHQLSIIDPTKMVQPPPALSYLQPQSFEYVNISNLYIDEYKFISPPLLSSPLYLNFYILNTPFASIFSNMLFNIEATWNKQQKEVKNSIFAYSDYITALQTVLLKSIPYTYDLDTMSSFFESCEVTNQRTTVDVTKVFITFLSSILATQGNKEQSQEAQQVLSLFRQKNTPVRFYDELINSTNPLSLYSLLCPISLYTPLTRNNNDIDMVANNNSSNDTFYLDMLARSNSKADSYNALLSTFPILQIVSNGPQSDDQNDNESPKMFGLSAFLQWISQLASPSNEPLLPSYDHVAPTTARDYYLEKTINEQKTELDLHIIQSLDDVEDQFVSSLTASYLNLYNNYHETEKKILPSSERKLISSLNFTPNAIKTDHRYIDERKNATITIPSNIVTYLEPLSSFSNTIQHQITSIIPPSSIPQLLRPFDLIPSTLNAAIVHIIKQHEKKLPHIEPSPAISQSIKLRSATTSSAAITSSTPLHNSPFASQYYSSPIIQALSSQNNHILSATSHDVLYITLQRIIYSINMLISLHCNDFIIQNVSTVSSSMDDQFTQFNLHPGTITHFVLPQNYDTAQIDIYGIYMILYTICDLLATLFITKHFTAISYVLSQLQPTILGLLWFFKENPKSSTYRSYTPSFQSEYITLDKQLTNQQGTLKIYLSSQIFSNVITTSHSLIDINDEDDDLHLHLQTIQPGKQQYYLSLEYIMKQIIQYISWNHFLQYLTLYVLPSFKNVITPTNHILSSTDSLYRSCRADHLPLFQDSLLSFEDTLISHVDSISKLTFHMQFLSVLFASVTQPLAFIDFITYYINSCLVKPYVPAQYDNQEQFTTSTSSQKFSLDITGLTSINIIVFMNSLTEKYFSSIYHSGNNDLFNFTPRDVSEDDKIPHFNIYLQIPWLEQDFSTEGSYNNVLSSQYMYNQGVIDNMCEYPRKYRKNIYNKSIKTQFDLTKIFKTTPTSIDESPYVSYQHHTHSDKLIEQMSSVAFDSVPPLQKCGTYYSNEFRNTNIAITLLCLLPKVLPTTNDWLENLRSNDNFGFFPHNYCHPSYIEASSSSRPQPLYTLSLHNTFTSRILIFVQLASILTPLQHMYCQLSNTICFYHTAFIHQAIHLKTSIPYKNHDEEREALYQTFLSIESPNTSIPDQLFDSYTIYEPLASIVQDSISDEKIPTEHPFGILPEEVMHQFFSPEAAGLSSTPYIISSSNIFSTTSKQSSVHNKPYLSVYISKIQQITLFTQQSMRRYNYALQPLLYQWLSHFDMIRHTYNRDLSVSSLKTSKLNPSQYTLSFPGITWSLYHLDALISIDSLNINAYLYCIFQHYIFLFQRQWFESRTNLSLLSSSDKLSKTSDKPQTSELTIKTLSKRTNKRSTINTNSTLTNNLNETINQQSAPVTRRKTITTRRTTKYKLFEKE